MVEVTESVAIMIQRIAHVRLRTLVTDLGADQEVIAVPAQGAVGRPARGGHDTLFSGGVGVGDVLAIGHGDIDGEAAWRFG